MPAKNAAVLWGETLPKGFNSNRRSKRNYTMVNCTLLSMMPALMA